MPVTIKPDNSIEVFFSFSHKDKKLRDELSKHLSTLKQEGLIRDWSDREIRPGDEWEHEILEHLSTAQIILLLISPDFLASNFCSNIEMERAF